MEDYKIIEKIGEGAFGKVYKVEKEGDVKVLKISRITMNVSVCIFTT